MAAAKKKVSETPTMDPGKKAYYLLSTRLNREIERVVFELLINHPDSLPGVDPGSKTTNRVWELTGLKNREQMMRVLSGNEPVPKAPAVAPVKKTKPQEPKPTPNASNPVPVQPPLKAPEKPAATVTPPPAPAPAIKAPKGLTNAFANGVYGMPGTMDMPYANRLALKLIGDGLGYNDIAAGLDIKPKKLRPILQELYAAFNVHSAPFRTPLDVLADMVKAAKIQSGRAAPVPAAAPASADEPAP